MIRWFQAILLAVNIPLFVVFGVRALYLRRRERSPRFRSLLLAGAGLAAVAVVGALFHLGTLAVDAEVISSGARDVVLLPLQGGAAALAISMGVAAWKAYCRAKAPLARAERVLVANAVTPLNVSIDELGLTARELEVLEGVLDGDVDDSEIAERLFVTPATAASHVASIMRKADARSRRDLLTLLPPPKDAN